MNVRLNQPTTCVMLLSLGMAVAGCGGSAAAVQERSFTAIYRSTLDWSEELQGYDWEADDHEWLIDSFVLDLGEDLSVKLGPSSVVFGVHDDNVLWAAVCPQSPGILRSSLAGDGESVKHLWLRFHPMRVGELFPDETIRGKGAGAQVLWAKRLCYWKVGSSWQQGNLPAVPAPNALTVDLDAGSEKRRFFSVDLSSRAVKYVDVFENRPLPSVRPMESEQALATFDQVWQAFDHDYAMFGLKAGLDWARVRTRYSAAAGRCTTNYQLAAVLARMLATLRDEHVWVECGAEQLPVYFVRRKPNINWKAVKETLPTLHQSSSGLAWAQTADGIGYISVGSLKEPGLVLLFDEALESLERTWALILDLRLNGGGDEGLARQLAGRFMDRPRTYAFSRFRNGPNHNDLTDPVERVCEPRGPWRYAGPVIVLIGPKTRSSAESLALMLAQCPTITTMGERTAGSSGNPRFLNLDGDIRVSLPTWLDLNAAKDPLEGEGVIPDVVVKASRIRRRDAVMDAALDRHRRIPDDARTPSARRDQMEPSTEASASQLWQRFVDVNSSWLSPQPPSMAYQLVEQQKQKAGEASYSWVDVTTIETSYRSANDVGFIAHSIQAKLADREEHYVDGSGLRSLAPSQAVELSYNRRLAAQTAADFLTPAHAFARWGLPKTAHVVHESEALSSLQINGLSHLESPWQRVWTSLTCGLHPLASWPSFQMPIQSMDEVTIEIDRQRATPTLICFGNARGDSVRIQFIDPWHNLGGKPVPGAVYAVCRVGSRTDEFRYRFEVQQDVWLATEVEYIPEHPSNAHRIQLKELSVGQSGNGNR
jgi:carboxyl-terminal processing protease